jgi:hypothetical protein
MNQPRTVALVTGSRQLACRDDVEDALACLCPELTDVIVGDCRTGADAFAIAWCERTGVQCNVHIAHWQKYGRAAGPRRNGHMVECARLAQVRGANVVVLAFPRGGPGTDDCIRQARAAGLGVVVL